MKFIKRVLFFFLNERVYFRLISLFFFILYFSGILRIFRRFRIHYFIPELIRKGDTIIDIGANLGYFTRIFSRATGKDGTVWAVEPIPLYREILKKNISHNSNIIIIPFALGDRESTEYMGIPGNQPYRHGLTRIIEARDNAIEEKGLPVEVKTPEAIFGNLDKIDFIKCDIEGYEDKVIPGFLAIIRSYKPIIQIEVEPANRKLIDDILINEGYIPFITVKGGLRRIGPAEENTDDIIYLHISRKDQLKDFINNYSI